MSRFLLLAACLSLGLASCVCTSQPQGNSGVAQPVGGEAPGNGTVDLEQKPLAKIPVGTVITDEAPKDWSHLVLIAIPTLTDEDRADAPRMAVHYAQLFKLTVLARVTSPEESGKTFWQLGRVARGFATTINGTETIISADDTRGADMGLFGKTIIEENEKILDKDVRQVARTDTMLVFDAKSVVLRGGKHVPMIMRHAILVAPSTGKLFTLVWLLTPEYEAAEKAMQLLPTGMHEKRYLSVDRDKFNALGIPSKDAFALRQLPQGTPVVYSPQLRQLAGTSKFTAEVTNRMETALRAVAVAAEKE